MIMELKKWDQYSDQEKYELLFHWWFYYGKMIITEEENREFQELARCFPNQIMNFATLSYIVGKSSQPLICAMREGQLEKVVGITAMDIGRFEGNATFFHAKEELLSTLVQSYNHPEPSIPMSKEEIDQQLRNMGHDPDRAVHINSIHLKF